MRAKQDEVSLDVSEVSSTARLPNKGENASSCRVDTQAPARQAIATTAAVAVTDEG